MHQVPTNNKMLKTKIGSYFWISIEQMQMPADARAAPSASAPNDIDMGIPSSPKRPRDPAQDNKVRQRAMPFAPAMLESPARRGIPGGILFFFLGQAVAMQSL